MVEEKPHNVVIPTLVTLAPCLHTPLMVASTDSGVPFIEPKTLRASRASLQVANGIIDVSLGQAIYLILTNLSEEQVFVPNLMIIA